MQIYSELSAERLANKDQFSDDFYNRFSTSTRPYDLELKPGVVKQYSFPTFYGDVTQAMAIFLCSAEKARKLLPHPKMKPINMFGGRTLVVFSCYEYKHVHEMKGYNEIAMLIPVLADPTVNVPVLPMVMGGAFKKFGYYVFSMPVTSVENTIRGQKIWGLPKVTQEITLTEQDGWCTTVAKEESGEPYFELKVPTDQGSDTHFDVSANLYSELDGKILQAETNFKGNYKVAKYMGQLFGSSKPDTQYLKLGDTPSGELIRSLDIAEHPFQFRFAKHVTSCFDLPNEDYKGL